jgi:hypothetical protein
MVDDARLNRPSRFWRSAAVIFLIGNAAGAVFAFVRGEQMHAEMHLVLFGAAFVGYAFSRAAQIRHSEPAEQIEDPRVEQLQRSVDAMALELERLGEAQRYRDKLAAEHRDTPGEH